MLSWGFLSPLIRKLDVRMHFNVMFKQWKLALTSHLTSVKGQNSSVHRMWDSCSMGVMVLYLLANSLVMPFARRREHPKTGAGQGLGLYAHKQWGVPDNIRECRASQI